MSPQSLAQPHAQPRPPRARSGWADARPRPAPAQEPADERCDYVPVPPVGFDDEGYPVEDSVGQSDRHSKRTANWHLTLRDWCREHGLGEVFSDLIMPYRRGQRNKVVAPDLMVSSRAERRDERPSYKLWLEPTPEFVLEALSNSTWRADVGAKRRLYRGLGVREYWLFDPGGRRVRERLRGYRLRRAATKTGDRLVYRMVPENSAGRRPSEVLGLELCVVGDDLRFHDPVAGEHLATRSELAAKANAEKARADTQAERADVEKARADAAERRIAALEAQLRGPRRPD